MWSAMLEWIRRLKWLPPARRLEWYPPFRSLRIRVLELDAEGRVVRIRLPLNAHNRNPGGGMFGGAMAALADPIAALSCNRRFPGYAVWTRDLQLDFRHEGRTDLELRFEFPAGLEHAIRQELTERGRATPQFEYGFYDASGQLCAQIKTRVAIRPLDYRPSAGALGHRRQKQHEEVAK